MGPVKRLLALVVCSAAATLTAKADTLDFVFSGPDTISFSRPSSINVGYQPIFAFFNSIPVTFDGQTTYGSPAFREVLPGFFNGGFSLYHDTLSQPDSLYYSTFDGPQLFTESGTTATFLTGSFQLTETTFQAGGSNTPLYSGVGTLTITDRDRPTSVTPEPSTLTLLCTGMFAAFTAGSRRLART